MATYQALEIHKDGKGTGKFRYTVTDGGGTRAFGYCADNCPGHNTRAEAEAHCDEYLLANSVAVEDKDRQERCASCGEWTQNRYAYGAKAGWLFGERVPLCSAHLTLEHLAQAVANAKKERRR